MTALLLLAAFGGILLVGVGIRHRHDDAERHFWWALSSFATAILAIGVGIGFAAGGVTDTNLWGLMALTAFIYMGSTVVHVHAYANHGRDAATPETPKSYVATEPDHVIWRGGDGYHLQ